MNLKESAIKGVYWTGLHQVGTTIVRFIVSIILARLLLPEEFGLIASIAIIQGIGSLLLNAGLTSSLIRSKDIGDADLSTVFTFNFLGSLLIYAITFICAPLVAAFYEQEILTLLIRVQSIAFIIQAFATVQSTILTKGLHFKRLTFIAIPSIVIGALVGIYMALNGYGVWSLVGQSLTTSFFSSLLLSLLSKWRPKLSFDWKVFKKHFGFGSRLTISGIINTIFNNFYVIFIGKFFPIAQVGHFQRASSLGMYPSLAIATVVNKVTYPLMAKINDDVVLKRALQKIIKTIIFILAPVLIVMAALATPMFRFLFTEKWLPAVPYFRILIVNAMLFPIHGFHVSILKTKGRSDLVLKSEIIKKGLLTIILAGSFSFGIYGLLIGSVFASILALFVNIYYSSKVVDYSIHDQCRDIVPTFLLSFMVGVLIYIIDSNSMVTNASDFFRLLIGGLITVILYPTLTYFFKFEAFQEVKNLIAKK